MPYPTNEPPTRAEGVVARLFRWVDTAAGRAVGMLFLGVLFTAVVALGVLVSWSRFAIPFLLSFFAEEEMEHLQYAGQFGDMFGAFNGVVSTFTLIGLAITIWLQNRQLELAKADSLHQRTEGTFFQMLGNLNSIIELTEIQTETEGPNGTIVETISGRRAFRALAASMKEQLELYLSQLTPNGRSINDDAQAAVDSFYEAEVQRFLPHYFRTLFYMIKWLASHEAGKQSGHLEFLAAQLSNDELELIRLHIHSTRGASSREVVERSGILNGLSIT